MASDSALSPPPVGAVDPEVFASRISGIVPGVSISKIRKAQFSGEAVAVILPELRLVRFSVRNFEVTAPAGRSYLSVSFPLLNGFNTIDRGTKHGHDAMNGHVLTPDSRFHLLTEKTTCLVANIDISLVNSVAASLSGDHGDAGLRFDDRMPLMDSRAAAFWREATRLWCDARRDPSLAQSTIAVREREGILIEQLLTFLRVLDGQRAARSDEANLRHTEDWIVAHLDEPITRANLCAVSGMNLRTLTRAFRRRHGQSPMAFVRERRLDEVRRRLLGAIRAETSVSDIALDHGFCHLGRFSADYRRAFGELPSETLRH
jgi:AraC-like DNA-binding protein